MNIQGSPDSSATPLIVLMCRLVDDKEGFVGKAFSLRVSPTMVINELQGVKDAIRDKNLNALGHIDANNLVLSKLLKQPPTTNGVRDDSTGNELLEVFYNDRSSVARSLDPADIIAEHFQGEQRAQIPRPPGKH
jgi:hypothetical protein